MWHTWILQATKRTCKLLTSPHISLLVLIICTSECQEHLNNKISMESWGIMLWEKKNPYSGNMALRGIFRLCVHACMCVCLCMNLWDWNRNFESWGFKFHLCYCKLILFRCSNSLVEVVLGDTEKDYLDFKKRRNRLPPLAFALKWTF